MHHPSYDPGDRIALDLSHPVAVYRRDRGELAEARTISGRLAATYASQISGAGSYVVQVERALIGDACREVREDLLTINDRHVVAHRMEE